MSKLIAETNNTEADIAMRRARAEERLPASKGDIVPRPGGSSHKPPPGKQPDPPQPAQKVRPHLWRVVLAYFVAAGLSAVLLYACAAFEGFFKNPPLLVFTFPIILSAYLGGWG